jgi:pimeloyl-ACP methyl ester carboxylesterase
MLAAERPSPEQARRFLARLGHDEAVIDGLLPEEFFEMLAASQELPGYATAWSTLVERCLTLRGAVPGVRLGREELRRVRQRTLFVWGVGDAFGGPEIGERAARLMPRARVEAVAGGASALARRAGGLRGGRFGIRAIARARRSIANRRNLPRRALRAALDYG